jgi:concanavalin A-like lectin/glucanase superfamily protein
MLLMPIAVLGILLLFGLTGCTTFGAAPDTTAPPASTPYDQVIKGESSLVAYWRLGEPAGTGVPSTGTAKDEKGAHNGNYNKAVITADPKRHSFNAPGDITLGIAPGLLQHFPTAPGIEVNGGFVEVPFDSNLNASPFTFEAWVIPEFGGDPQGNFYCLVESSAPAGGVAKKAGWALYAGPNDPTKINQPYQWQVWMGNGTKFQRVGIATDSVHFNQLTYLALTFDPGVATNNLTLFLYYPDTKQDLSAASVAPLQATVTGFQPNNSPGGGSFLIGIGRNLFPTITADPVALQPFLYAFRGKIQEVAFYNTALAADKHLWIHEQSGGDF